MAPDIKPNNSPSNIPSTNQNPAQPQEPPIPAQPLNLPPLENEPQKNSKKKKIIIAVVLIILILGGAIAAFFLWYSNPDKAVSDAVQNAMKSKTIDANGLATIQGANNSGKVTVAFDTKADNSTGESMSNAKATFAVPPLKLSVSGAYATDSKGASYVKLNNTKPIISNLTTIAMLDKAAEKPLNQLATKTNNKWVKLSQDDLTPAPETITTENQDGETTGQNKQSEQINKCSSKVIKNFYQDQKQQNELLDIYKDNKFIVIKNTGKSENIQGSDSVQYDISLDETKITSFIKEAIETDAGKTLQKCYPDFIVNEIKNMKDIEIDDSVALSLWVSRWSHQLTRVQAISEEESNKSTIKIDTKFNEDVDVTMPTNVISTKELQKDIQAVFTSLITVPDVTIQTEE